MKKVILFLAAAFLMTIICIAGAKTTYADEVTVNNGIPVVYINIDESQGTIQDMLDSGDHSVYCNGTISIEVPEGFKYSDYKDVDLQSIEGLKMTIRGRGNSTWEQAVKKPFKIKLDKKTDILGLGANKHWVLLANAKDSTLIKDRITAWLGDQMEFDFTPMGVPVDLVLSGEIYGTYYLGSYYLSENVRVDSNRVDIAELDEDDTDDQVITGGYLLQNSLQVRKGSPDRFITYHGAEWATKTPSFDTESEDGSLAAAEDEDISKAGEEAFNEAEIEDAYENNKQQDYIQQYIQHFEDVLFNGSTDYRELMDVETAAKYWLINKVALNHDAYSSGSTYIYKDRDSEDGVSKLYWGPLWDFDYAWNYSSGTTGFSCGHVWTKALFYDKGEGGFVQELHKQWPKLKAAMEELIEDGGIIDQYYKETEESAIADHKLYHNQEDFDYKAEIDDLKQWIRDRIDWVDENFDLLDDMVYRITYIKDGEVYTNDFLEKGEYLEPENLIDVEKEGYTFLGWTDEDGNYITEPLTLTEDITLTAQFIADSEITHAVDIAMRKDSDIFVYKSPMFSKYHIEYEAVPSDAFEQKIVWTSSDESIAMIKDSGDVYVFSEGTVTFTAKLKYGKTRTFTLTIVKDHEVKAASMSPVSEEIEMKTGEYSALYVKTDPSPATLFDFQYTSDDENVVSVDEYGALKANVPGKSVVHVRAVTQDEDGNQYQLETSVTVIVKDAEPETEPTTDPTTEPTTEPTTASAADPTKAAETTTEAAPGTTAAAPAETTAVGSSKKPATGDTMGIQGVIWAVIAAAAIAVLAGAVRLKKMK